METLNFVNPNNDILTLPEESILEFRAFLDGDVLLPDDEEYEDSRQVWNGMIDRKPSMITKCSNTIDIQKSLEFARNHQMSVTVRGGGHHVAGSAVCDKCMMIDLSGMKNIEVDLVNKTVSTGPGVTWGS